MKDKKGARKIENKKSVVPKKNGLVSLEKLYHFNCLICKKWWTVGGAPISKKNWFCPWCGIENFYTL